MTELIGLIEIEPLELAVGEPIGSCDDATLDQLFAQLVGRPALQTVSVPSLNREPTIVLSANLDALADDLETATRDVLAQIFLSLGRR